MDVRYVQRFIFGTQLLLRVIPKHDSMAVKDFDQGIVDVGIHDHSPVDIEQSKKVMRVGERAGPNMCC